MSLSTGIAWTDSTFNPWIGCTRVSEGCRGCYAEAFVTGRMGADLWGPSAPRRVTAVSTWKGPLAWNREAGRTGRRRRVFSASLADVFDSHPTAEATRPRFWGLVRETPNLDWIVLTKRPERIAACLPPAWGEGWPNVWIGATVESRNVLSRLDHLRAVPAVVRFVSAEPLLDDLGDVDLSGIAWVIVGGETGRDAREMNPDWARSLRDRCRAAGVAFFMKQMTRKAPIPADLLVREWPSPDRGGAS